MDIERGHALGQVHVAASTHSDHGIGLKGAGDIRCFEGNLDGWFGLSPGKNLYFDTRFSKRSFG